MSPRPPDRAQWVSGLREALTTAGYSVRSLAREFAGKEASEREAESQRRKINKWVDPKGTVYPSVGEAERLERTLKVRSGTFTVRPPRRDRLAAIADELADLRQAIAALEKGQRVLERRIREAAGQKAASPAKRRTGPSTRRK